MTCALCHQPICDHPDATYAGVVTIDTTSEPGSYERALRHRGQVEEATRRFHADLNPTFRERNHA